MASTKPGSVEQDQALTEFDCSSLKSMENIDRTSPELWPENSVSDFINSFTPQTTTKLPYSKEFTHEDQDHLHELAALPTAGLIAKVKELHDIAYKLGQEEAKEIARGKLLNVFNNRSHQNNNNNNNSNNDK